MSMTAVQPNLAAEPCDLCAILVLSSSLSSQSNRDAFLQEPRRRHQQPQPDICPCARRPAPYGLRQRQRVRFRGESRLASQSDKVVPWGRQRSRRVHSIADCDCEFRFGAATCLHLDLMARERAPTLQRTHTLQIVDSLKTLTLLEAAELVKEIETTFGVDAR